MEFPVLFSKLNPSNQQPVDEQPKDQQPKDQQPVDKQPKDQQLVSEVQRKPTVTPTSREEVNEPNDKKVKYSVQTVQSEVCFHSRKMSLSTGTIKHLATN